MAAQRHTRTGDHGSSARPLAPGARVGRYRISRVLEDRTDEVGCEGEHVALRYRVTIRVMRLEHGEEQRARFRREAQLGAVLQHRHIVQVLEVGDLGDGWLYLVMEHVDGCSLAQLVAQRRLSAAATMDLGVQILGALTAASAHGIVHADIAPESIVLERSSDGQVTAKLLGFGIFAAIRTELAARRSIRDGVGTSSYASPEQTRKEGVDVRTDVYALAAVLYEALSGRTPRDGATADARARRLRRDAPNVPRELARILDRALARDPDERWSNPAEMAEALRGAARHLRLARGADAWADVVFGPGILDGLGASSESISELESSEREPSDRTKAAPRRPRWRSARATIGRSAGPAVAIGLCVLAAGELVTSYEAYPANDRRLTADAAEQLLADPPAGRVRAPPDEGQEAARRPEAEPEVMAEGRVSEREVGAPLPVIDLPARPSIDDRALADIERGARDSFVRGDPAAATDMYLHVVAQAPGRATAWRGLGLVAAASGDHDRARRALRRYLELAPQSSDRTRIERELDRLR